MERTLFLKKMQEKKEGRGEDSDPILFHDDNVIVVGVFDGMGGAGSSEVDSEYTVDGQFMTNAYVGSRIVRTAIEQAIIENPSIVIEGDFANRLKDIIIERYAQEKEKYPPRSNSGLRSKLILDYPTTLAIATIIKSGNEYIIDSYWAGDSRNYLWSKDGLFQLSIDDLKGGLDPLQNLHEDAPMSNCVHADGSFTINHKRIILPDTQTFAVFSATDGCFGYFRSPMDFYKALCDSLKKSDDMAKWNENLAQSFAAVAADDFSYSLAVIGYKQFKDFRKDFQKPGSLLREYFNHRNLLEDKLKRLTKLNKEISDMNEKMKAEIVNVWSIYQESYMKFVK